MTYQQMDCLSNDLAHKLVTKGVQRKTLVALYMDKSIEMFLSILAIHKAGGGYVPLDPEYPAERIRAIIDLAQVTVVMTTRELHEQIESVLSGTGIACLLVDFNQLSSAPKPDVGSVSRSDISHVLFTSGSTGIPKGIGNTSCSTIVFTSLQSGVILTHGAVIESIVASREVIGVQDSRVLQFANYTFDISVWVSMMCYPLSEMSPHMSYQDWGCTWTSGGTLCVVPKQRLIDDLGSVAEEMDVTFMFMTPTGECNRILKTYLIFVPRTKLPRSLLPNKYHLCKP